MQKVIIFYLYRNIENTESLAERERAVCAVLGLTGRIVIADEGINGTLEGDESLVEKYKKHILSDRRFVRMIIKESAGDGQGFSNMRVLIKNEIVSTQFPESVKPQVKTGKYMKAHDLKNLYQTQKQKILDKEIVIVDMRNDYETMAGSFEGSIKLPMEASRDLPAMMPLLSPYKDKKILTVCTAGVRCEKMSAYLLNQGFKDVSQLQNGIHGYMQAYPGEDFEGTLFTFDNRLTMDFGGERKVVGECFACDLPSENYIHCINGRCHKKMLVCGKCLENKKDYLCGRC
jgi:UPF0176 protein